MPDFSQPSRQGLVLGAALVALYGLQQESLVAGGALNHATFVECRRLIELLRSGKPATTGFERVIDRMAHAQQLMRVSYSEWAQCVPLTVTP
jgi:hypothetical protein